ncbi:alkaline phosphatase [Wenzhouxiangella limi]|uniref:Alkaline phosphatase n=1 Tax=Wenzhouxiangella limi TaxID=2707351 RepID=A0A845UX58_9GAMM|nr:alkaline phosphatase [Wenzhouxiangella limi]NDY95258.1 alkaline phosphatase [Wenzhouxiangella limi]
MMRKLLLSALLSCATIAPLYAVAANAVFIHPDGTGLGHWNAARLLYAGPDGQLNWDRMARLAAYRVHQENWLSTTSHAGATVHAYGKKVHHDSYGLDRDQPLVAASGEPMSLMHEAMAAGKRVGVVNSGHIGEPGTGVFLTSNESRGNVAEIAAGVMESGADLIFLGGEIFLLPTDVVGEHGQRGVRDDGRNLITEARSRGYTVIFSRDELLDLDPATDKVIGIFAAVDTYNDVREERLAASGLETYNPDQPSFDEMVAKALEVLSADADREFFLVAEEEGTDNFSNKANARGMLDAMGRADKAIGVTLDFIEANPDRPTLLLVGADSDAGSPGIWAPREPEEDYQLPEQSSSGAELDGPDGTGGRPFVSQPDQFGNRHVFGIAWAMEGDQQGSTVAKAHGYRSDLLPVDLDNTGVYKILHTVLFED